MDKATAAEVQGMSRIPTLRIYGHVHAWIHINCIYTYTVHICTVLIYTEHCMCAREQWLHVHKGVVSVCVFVRLCV